MKKNLKEAAEKRLAELVQKARAGAVTIEIVDSMTDSQKKQIASLNNQILRAAEKRAKAEFKEELLRRAIQKKKERILNNETKAKRARRTHLFMAFGGLLEKYQSVPQSLLRSLLEEARTKAEHARFVAEFREFFPAILADEKRKECFEALLQTPMKGTQPAQPAAQPEPQKKGGQDGTEKH